MVGEKEIDGVEDEEEKLLNLFGNSISVHIHYAFLDYTCLSDSNYRLEGMIMQYTGLDAWVAIVLTCYIQRKWRDGHRH